MSPPYDRPHIDLSGRFTTAPFKSKGQGGGSKRTPRERAAHGAALRQELGEAIEVFRNTRPEADGSYVQLSGAIAPDDLRLSKDGIQPGASQIGEDGVQRILLHVPDGKETVLDGKLATYQKGPLTKKQNIPQAKFEEVDAIAPPDFEVTFRGPASQIPKDGSMALWWEAWVGRGLEAVLEDMATARGCRISEAAQWLRFPEVTVIPVFASKDVMEGMIFDTFAIIEVALLTDTPSIFLDADKDDQFDWVRSFAEKVRWPSEAAPAVTLLDTGVNRAHALLEPALSPRDMHAVDESWGTDDTCDAHGTRAAGLALFGDLTRVLQQPGPFVLAHRLESSKIYPPPKAKETTPSAYGSILSSGISNPEERAPDRKRSFCLTITHPDVASDRPSSSSAILDQAASGTLLGDEEDAPRRLFCVAAGNAKPEIERDRIKPADENVVQDPSQAWNAITIGGYTDKTVISDEGLEDYEPFSGAGDLSPHTTTSTAWLGKGAIKPEVLFEAGNRAVRPGGRDVITPESLCLLSTGSSEGQEPLRSFDATSAATPLAARFSAQLQAKTPELWPETIRALMVHSASWPEPMAREFAKQKGVTQRARLLRRYGYGVPRLDAALKSATTSVALIAEAEIQPFKLSGRTFHECHYYPLPWPRKELEAIDPRENVTLKVCLSYFIEPNPGATDKTDPYRYQSYGLRFDLRRQGESRDKFLARINAASIQVKSKNAPSDKCWMFGPNSISAGSLHCDVWKGPAANLLTQDELCIYPVGGWWRGHRDREVVERKARYALVLTLTTEDQAIDLHAGIKAAIAKQPRIPAAVERGALS